MLQKVKGCRILYKHLCTHKLYCTEKYTKKAIHNLLVSQCRCLLNLKQMLTHIFTGKCGNIFVNSQMLKLKMICTGFDNLCLIVTVTTSFKIIVFNIKIWSVVTTFNTSSSFLAADHTLRLANGHVWSGRLEIFYNQRWRTLCESGFGEREAQVVCGMLNYSR